jgi:hypothetical protein
MLWMMERWDGSVDVDFPQSEGSEVDDAVDSG